MGLVAGRTRSAPPPSTKAIPAAKTPARWPASGKPLRKDIAAVISLGIIAVVVVLALGVPPFAPHSPTEQFADGLSDLGAPLPPDGKFWLGTDLLGRDLYSRLLFGGRNSR